MLCMEKIERRVGAADPDRGLWFCDGPCGVGIFRSGYTLAALLSSVDVPGGDGSWIAAQSLGIFHWNFRGGPLGLCEHCFDELLLGWPATARRMDSHGSCGQAGFADCGTSLVLQLTFDNRLRMGVFATEREISG